MRTQLIFISTIGNVSDFIAHVKKKTKISAEKNAKNGKQSISTHHKIAF